MSFDDDFKGPKDHDEPFTIDFSEPEESAALDAVRSGSFIGIYEDLPNEVYHSSPGLSFSGLKEFAKTPAHYQAYLRRDHEETPAQRIGTGVHMRVLEPKRFLTDVVTVTNRVTKENKERIAQAEAEGKWVLNSKEYDQINRIGDSVERDPIVKSLLVGGKPEQSVFWKDPATGILLKARPDYLRPDGVVVDLKTYGLDMDSRSLEKHSYKMSYHLQSRHYLNGVNHVLGLQSNLFAHVYIATEDPYLVRVVVLNDAALEKAQTDIEPLLEAYKQCLKSNNWPGYPTGIDEITIPDFGW